LTELEQSPKDNMYASIEKQKAKLEKGISLLIDSYTQQYITKDEFEPRIKLLRQNLKKIQEQQQQLAEQISATKELELVITNLEKFANGVASNLDNLDWYGRRDIIRLIVKRIEIGNEDINIVYKINKLPEHQSTSTQHCCNGTSGSEEGSVGVTQQIYSTPRHPERSEGSPGSGTELLSGDPSRCSGWGVTTFFY